MKNMSINSAKIKHKIIKQVKFCGKENSRIFYKCTQFFLLPKNVNEFPVPAWFGIGNASRLKGDVLRIRW